MNVIFETGRLLLHLFTADDALLVYELNRDPAVTRFTHDPINSLEKAGEVLEKTIMPQYVLYNYGRWAVHLRHNLEFIGWCGLKYRPEIHETDLGYRFMKKYWGRGYATEAAAASIRYGFQQARLQRITARAEKKNLASLKVLENCGMKYMWDEIIDGEPVRAYEIWNSY